MRAFKIFVLLIALLGIAAIGWYLMDRDGVMALLGEDSQGVKVQKISPSASTRAASAEPKPAAAPAPQATPAATPGNVSGMSQEQLAALSAAGVEEKYNAAHEVERYAFVTDYVRAVGENRAIEVAREHFSGPIESRNYELVYALSQVSVAEFNSRLGSYMAGILAYRGDGTARDLDSAMRYLRHESLQSSSSALYWRGMILLDPDYPNADRDSAVELLKLATQSGKEDENGVVLAKQKLEELGVK